MLKKSLQLKNITTFATLLFSLPLLTFAQIMNPLKTTNVPQIVSMVLTYITRVGGVVAIIAFIWVGFLFVKAQGNQTKLTEAKNVFLYTVIGVAILLGAQLLATLVVGTIKSL
jgi:hypothetical protein